MPILAMTAHALVGIRTNAWLLDIDDLFKPIRTSQLFSLIEKTLATG